MSNLNFVVQNKRGKACVADDISGVLLSDETVPPTHRRLGQGERITTRLLSVFCVSVPTKTLAKLGRHARREKKTAVQCGTLTQFQSVV